MATATRAASPPARPAIESVADLLEHLGGIPPHRVRWNPIPGTATERDLLESERPGRGLCEPVDATLVEKAVGYEESLLASALIMAPGEYLRNNDLGVVSGEGGAMRLQPGLVRLPDVAFMSWARRPRGGHREPYPAIAPDLAVEILSPSNTKAEIERKLDEYFAAGVRLAWIVDPPKRTVRVYTRRDRSVLKRESGTLDGGEVLPGFRLPIRDWFAKVEREGPRR